MATQWRSGHLEQRPPDYETKTVQIVTHDKGVLVKPSRQVYPTDPQLYVEAPGVAQDTWPPPSLPLMALDNRPPTGRGYPPEMQMYAGANINALMYSFQN